MPQLDPTWFVSQFFWLCICFFTLYFVVSKFLAPQIAKVKLLRQQKIDGYISQAQSFKQDAEKSLQAYEKAIKDAKEHAQEQIAKQKEDLAKLIADKNEDASSKLAKEVLKTEQMVNKTKEELMAKVDEIAASLSKDIIKKLDV